jgi:hypothetical protein
MSSKLYVDNIRPATGQSVAFGSNTGEYLLPTRVGDLLWRRDRQSVSASFPYWNLALPDQTLTSAVYPDYVTYLRNRKLEMPTFTDLSGTVSTSGASVNITFSTSQTISPGTWVYFNSLGSFRQIISGSGTTYVLDVAITASSQTLSVLNFNTFVSTFSGTWASTTFTLSNTGQNRALVQILNQDLLFGGGFFSNWMILRHSGLTTDTYISSANFAIGTRTVSLASGIPSGTTVEFYPFRTTNSTEARHKQVEDASPFVGGLQIASNLRVGDTLQSHWHVTYVDGTTGSSAGGLGNVVNNGNEVASNSTREMRSDGNNGTPRGDQFTRSRGFGVYCYEAVGRVIS